MSSTESKHLVVPYWFTASSRAFSNWLLSADCLQLLQIRALGSNVVSDSVLLQFGREHRLMRDILVVLLWLPLALLSLETRCAFLLCSLVVAALCSADRFIDMWFSVAHLRCSS